MTTGVEDAPERHEGFAHRLVTPAPDAAKPQTWLVKSYFLGFVFAYPISTTYLNGVFPISPPIFAIICSGEEGRWGLSGFPHPISHPTAPQDQQLKPWSLFGGAMAHFSISRDFLCSCLGRLKNHLPECFRFLCCRDGWELSRAL